MVLLIGASTINNENCAGRNKCNDASKDALYVNSLLSFIVRWRCSQVLSDVLRDTLYISRATCNWHKSRPNLTNAANKAHISRTRCSDRSISLFEINSRPLTKSSRCGRSTFFFTSNLPGSRFARRTDSHPVTFLFAVLLACTRALFPLHLHPSTRLHVEKPSLEFHSFLIPFTPQRSIYSRPLFTLFISCDSSLTRTSWQSIILNYISR